MSNLRDQPTYSAVPVSLPSRGVYALEDSHAQLYSALALSVADRVASYKGKARVPAEDISLASVSMLCHFWTLLLVSVLAEKSLAQCFTDVDCGGSTVPASSYQQCCDGTGSSVSYFDGDNCTACLLGKPF